MDGSALGAIMLSPQFGTIFLLITHVQEAVKETLAVGAV